MSPGDMTWVKAIAAVLVTFLSTVAWCLAVDAVVPRFGPEDAKPAPADEQAGRHPAASGTEEGARVGSIVAPT